MLAYEKLADELETFVDQTTLSTVLEALEYICYQKADHLRSNWQDESAAKEWERNGKLISKLTPKITV